MADATRERLEDGPPATLTELDRSSGFTPEQRRDGISRFDIRGGIGSTLGGVGYTESVYYLRGEHSPTDVIQKWMAVNPQAADNLPPWGLFQRISRNYGDEFRAAANELLGPFDGRGDNRDRGGDQDESGTCPICGTEFDRGLARHIRSDCGRE